MNICYHCKRKHDSVKELILHYKVCCKVSCGIAEFICGEDGCLRRYCSALSFKKHLLKFHTSQMQSIDYSQTDSPGLSVPHYFDENLVSSVLPVNSQSTDCSQSESAGPSVPPDFDENPVFSVPQVNSLDGELAKQSQSDSIQNLVTGQMSHFVSSLYADPKIPRNIVQTVISSLQNYLSSSTDVLLQQFQAVIPVDEKTRHIHEIVEQSLVSNLSALNEFRSEYSRLQYFKKIGTYADPSEVVIGKRLENKRSKTGTLSLIPVKCSLQIFPITFILSNFFSIKNVLKDTLSYINSLKSTPNPVTNVIQGSVWQRNLTMDVENEITLPIIVYFDDFEVGNPLGSHAGVHKLGAVYVSLPCLPPHYVSLLQNIFLLALFHSSDRVEFGNGIIFQKVIEQLNYLRVTGIAIKSIEFEGAIKFSVVCITGDNLGLNGVLGFVESFVANYPCRICNANKEQIKTLCFEEEQLLRNSKDYEEKILVIEPSLTGIKEKCVWLGLKGFDLFENVAVDVLHDYLEGCCRYIMKFVIETIVQKQKLISFQNLQLKLRTFDYGPDMSSKPANALVFEGSSIKVKTSASEMLTLVRYFGLIVGYYIPEDDVDKTWDLYIILRRLLDKLLTHNVYSDTSEQIKYLVSELNELYKKLTRTFLTPKFHFLTHYPNMFQKYGPLIQVWTMRFEAKHRISKFVARACMSKVNICKTIAIKNQLALSDIFLKGNPLELIQFGLKKKTSDAKLNDLKLKYNNFLSEHKTIYSLSWVKVKGIRFKPFSVVTVDLCKLTLLPIFAQVQEVLITENNEVLFDCLLLKTSDFNDHYFAYEVNKTNDNFMVTYDNLITPVTNTLTVMQDLTYYVTLRWTLD